MKGRAASLTLALASLSVLLVLAFTLRTAAVFAVDDWGHVAAFGVAPALARFFTALVEPPLALLPFLALAIWAWGIGRPARILVALGAIGGSYALVEIVKLVVQRARPDYCCLLVKEEGWSFPSAHAAIAAALATSVVLLAVDTGLRRLSRVAVATAATVFVSAVAWSRLALGAHFLTDVAGGFFAGVASALLAHLTVRRVPARLRFGLQY